MIVKLKDVVNRINNNIDRFHTDIQYYLGKGHGECGEIAITEHGDLKQDVGTLGFKFHFAFKPGDSLFFSRSFALRKAGMAMYEGICSDSTYILRSKDENKLSPEYLPSIIQSDQFWEYCDTHHTGGVNFLINWSTLADYEFDLPPIEEQKKLADKLWAAYRLKESYKKLLAATDEMVKSQFIEMFGDTHAPSVNSKQWKSVVNIINGKDYKPVQIENGGYPVYGTGGEMARASDYLSPENSILLGRKGTIDKPLLIKEKFWNVDTAFAAVPDASVLDYIYFYWHCKTIDFKTLNKGTTLPSTTKVDLLDLWITIPPIEKQQEFASIVRQADKSEFELRKSIEAIDAVIKSLINN